MGREGFEPSTKGFRFVCLSTLAGLCLHPGFRCRWVPSSLYTFPCGLGSALSCALLRLEFADFDTIPCAISQHSHGTTFRYESPALTAVLPSHRTVILPLSPTP